MRSVTKLHERWFYLPGDTPSGCPPRFRDAAWQEVKLPHTPEEGFPDRYWYCKAAHIERMEGERVYLRVDSPAANCRVFADGREVERLRAGMTHTVELTSHHRRTRPLQIAFRFKGEKDGTIGGFPRGLSLYVVPRSHFAFDAKGAWGVSVQPEILENGSAKVKASAVVMLPEEEQKISFAIGGPNVSVPATVPAAEFAIPRPRFWMPMDPFLYSLRAILSGQDRTHLDTVDVPFGVREFKLKPEGLLWNGMLVPTRGVIRETPPPGGGLSRERELALLGELGADTLLLTGTPEEDAFFDTCDKVGLRVLQSVSALGSFKKREDGLNAAKKLVFRLINHPCVAGWVMPVAGEDENSVRALCELIRNADPGRPIILTGCEPDIIYNWGDFPADAAALNIDFKDKAALKTLDKLRAEKPSLPLALVQEDNAADERLAGALLERPWLIAFGTARLYAGDKDGALLSKKNEPEDGYYLLRSLWTIIRSEESGERSQDEVKEGGEEAKEGKPDSAPPPAMFKPFVHICAFDRENPKRVVVYSNAGEVALTVNGQELAAQKGQGIFVFDGVVLNDGANQALAKAGEATHARALNNN